MTQNDSLDKYVDLAVDLDQWGVDQAIEQFKPYIPALESVSEGLPIVKVMIALLTLPKTIQDIAFGVKVNEFLYNSEIDQSKVEKLKKKLGKKRNSRLWERIILSINSHDDKLKSAAVGKLAKALIDDFISYEKFFDMVHVTNNMNMHTLDILKGLYNLDNSSSLPSGRHYDFMSTGLIGVNRVAGMSWGGTGGHSINQFGWKYTGIVLDYPESSIKGYFIGKDVLVDVYSSNTSSELQGTYPLGYVIKQNLSHDEVDIFIINDVTQVLCDESTGLPLIAESGFIEAGEDNRAAAARIAAGRLTPKTMLLHGMNDVAVRKNMFVALGSDRRATGTIFRTTKDIDKTIAEKEETDEIKYLAAALAQIKRIESGELKLDKI
jgi:hypothetical protein